jgi:hypothetical protein
MANQQLADFIKAEQALGKTQDEIIATLKANGWSDENIKTEFAGLQSPQAQPVPAPQPQYQPQPQFRPQAAASAAQPGSIGLKGIIITIVIFLLVAGGLVGFIYFKKKSRTTSIPTQMMPGPNMVVPVKPAPTPTP